MFSHIIIFGSSLPELLGGHSLCVIICGRVLIDAESTANRILVANHRTPCPPDQLRHDFMLGESGLLKMEYNFSCLRENSGWQRRRDHEPTAICCGRQRAATASVTSGRGASAFPAASNTP